MGAKWKDMEESPLIFMDWPEIEINEDNIILKSSITRVIIGNKKRNHANNTETL